MKDWRSIGITKPTKERFNKAMAQIRLETEQYNDLTADDALNHILDEAGY